MVWQSDDPIFRAMARANPEEEGSLLRELAREHPDLPRYVEDTTKTLLNHSRRRSRYVPGWSAPKQDV